MASAVSPTSKPRPQRRATVVVGLAVLVLVVVVSAGVLIDRALTPASTVQGPHFPGQPLHDALGLFSATTPPGWKVTGLETPNGECLSGVCYNTEDYTFHDQQPGDTHLSVTIMVLAFNSSEMPYCPSYLGLGGASATKTTVDGLPAVSLGDELVFNSGNASFQIGINIRPRPAFESPPLPTVTDAASVEAQAQAIINSIQVTNRGSCK